MALTNTQLCYYDSNVLRLPADKRTEYHAQVDRLISELSKSIRGKTEIKITRVVKAGSFAKFTILRKTSVDPVDVDVVFYVSGRNVDQETLSSLNDMIYDLLIKVYPNKVSRTSRFSGRLQRSPSSAAGSAWMSSRSSRTRSGRATGGSSTSRTDQRFRPAHRVRSSSFATERKRTGLQDVGPPRQKMAEPR